MELIDILIIINSLIILGLIFIVYKLYDTVNKTKDFANTKLLELKNTIDLYHNKINELPLTIENKINILIDKLNSISNITSNIPQQITSNIPQQITSNITQQITSNIPNQISPNASQIAGNAFNIASSLF